jgi:hypothetical protein
VSVVQRQVVATGTLPEAECRREAEAELHEVGVDQVVHNETRKVGVGERHLGGRSPRFFQAGHAGNIPWVHEGVDEGRCTTDFNLSSEEFLQLEGLDVEDILVEDGGAVKEGREVAGGSSDITPLEVRGVRGAFIDELLMAALGNIHAVGGEEIGRVWLAKDELGALDGGDERAVEGLGSREQNGSERSSSMLGR